MVWLLEENPEVSNHGYPPWTFLRFHFAGTPGRLNDYLEAGMVQNLCIQKNESHKKGKGPKVSKGVQRSCSWILRIHEDSWGSCLVNHISISENLLEIQPQIPMPSNAAGWRIDTWELQESGFGWGAQGPGRPGRGNLSPNPSPTTSHSPGRSHVRHGFRATVPWLPGFPLNRSTLLQKNTHMAMDQYLLIPFLVGWTSIYQLFWCSPGVPGFWHTAIWCVASYWLSVLGCGLPVDITPSQETNLWQHPTIAIQMFEDICWWNTIW